MSKSIVVINTPKNCRKCPFRESPWSFCLGEYEKEKHCPLKPMPQKKEVKGDFYKQREFATQQNTLIDFDRGYNACIDEILGETE